MNLLVAHRLHYRTHADRELISDVSFNVHAREMVGVIGPNGAGKSTLLKLLAGLLVPTSGDIALDTQPLLAMTPTQRARVIAYLEQRPQLHWPLRVQQVVELARLAFNDPDSAAIVAATMQATATDSLAQRDFLQLSEGEKLLVNLARTLAAQPQLLLADEPTAALDPANQHHIMQVLQQRARTGMGIVVVLHDLTLAARYCDRLVLLQQGRVVAQGAPAVVLAADNLRAAFRINARLDVASNTVIIDDRAGA